MKQFITSIIIIIIAIGLLFLITNLFNFRYVQNHISRQLIVWIILIITILISFKIVVEINREGENKD